MASSRCSLGVAVLLIGSGVLLFPVMKGFGWFPNATEQKGDFQYGKATAHAIYHLALQDLTEGQADEFERLLQEVSGEDDEAQRQYVDIASDITLAAVYGITDDDPTELLMGKAREEMLDAKLDQRKMMILELQYLAQAALSAQERAANVRVHGEDLARARRNFERAKKLLEAALMKYTKLYPPAPTR